MDELYFCASCFQYVAGAELLAEETDNEDGDPVCPHCGADSWYFGTVEFHGSFTEEVSAQLLAEWAKNQDLGKVTKLAHSL